MPRSASVSVPKRLSFELEDALPRGVTSPGPREYDSWPCDSFFLLPDAVLAMDAGVFRADLKALDPVLSASLPDWPLEDSNIELSSVQTNSPSIGTNVKSKLSRDMELEKRPFTLLHNHKGLLVRSSGKGTVLIGGGGDTSEGSSATNEGGGISAPIGSSSTGHATPATNGPTKTSPPQQESQSLHNPLKAASAISKDSSQKDGIDFDHEILASCADEPYSLPGPNELFFGGADRSSGLSYKDREERVRQMRERQQNERHQKLEELKEQAASAQRFREQQEAVRRQRLDDMKSKDSERRTQVEERKRIIQQAEQERREAVLRKSAERENRLELKRRQERSNVVFAFGSSTPRMLDPKENIQNYFGARRATSTTNVNLSDSSSSVRRSSECQEPELSRKRATSAHSLNRKPDGEEASTQRPFVPPPPTAARRRTDLLPAFPSLRDSNASTRSSPRHRSPGRALSLGRLDQLARPRPQRPPSLAPLHESPSSREKRMTPARTMSKSMSHLGPQHARNQIGSATDGVGVPVADGSLDRRSSRSSLALAHPRMTRSEMLRLSKLRGNLNAQGIRSGTVTPGSPSRPTSALSQASGGSQVMLRNRTSPKKPRPLSIAGSTLSSADKPRDSPAAAAAAAAAASSASPASPNRESRSIDRKLSNGSITSKPLRAKSVGSDRSAPSTPAKTPRGTTPKRTPAQVKAESAAKKALDRSKAAPKLRSTPKTTPLQSPTVESKPLPGADKIAKKEVEPEVPDSEVLDTSLQDVDIEVVTSDTSEQAFHSEIKLEVNVETKEVEIVQVEEHMEVAEAEIEVKEEEPTENIEPLPVNQNVELAIDAKPELEEDKAQLQAQRAGDKPVTGYASEEVYKAALAEKRRQAREAKEREQELERQRKMEEEEKERREEEEYLKLMEDQRKAEEERLKKAIEEAERQRQEESLKREEEERLRIENEKIEEQKKVEAEEKMRKEEEERQMRKSRVAAIMSRTRGKGPSGSTPSKNEPKTPSDESKNLNDSLMSSSMTEALINNLSSSMTDSMIVQAIESHQSQKGQQVEIEQSTTESYIQPPSIPSSQPPSDVSSQLLSDLSSQPLSDVSSQGRSDVDINSQMLIDTHPESGDFSVTKIGSSISADKSVSIHKVEDIISGVECVNLLEAHVNGNPPVPMDTTPTSQTVDLLGSFNGVNGISHNGVDSSTFQSTERHDNQFGSLNPFSSSAQTILTAEVKSDPFDQIIDLNQAKLTNEDAVNSNPPPPPIIAFEDNLNRKSQTQETSSNVPDLLL